jgi:hypothetical protein
LVRWSSADVQAHPDVVGETVESIREPDDYLNHPIEARDRRHMLDRELISTAGRVFGLCRDVGDGRRGHA